MKRKVELPNSASLLSWYDKNARSLPWRVSPQDRKRGKLPNPYHVWLSEIMLQQTTVPTVSGYFDKFISIWPTINDLASANENEVLAAWSGLGYYNRARNLKKCAEILVKDFATKFPKTEEELLKLPGIGAYTAAAILTIAFDRPATVVDGNVERVISRIFSIKTPLPDAKKIIRQYATQLTPIVRVGDYSQAVMDLGATICTPKNPKCNICPWQSYCSAQLNGNSEIFPIKKVKKPKPTRYGLAFVAIRADGAILLRKRPPSGLLASMAEVPNSKWVEGNTATLNQNYYEHAPFEEKWQKIPLPVHHTFTHFHLEILVWYATVDNLVRAPKGHWWSVPSAIETEPLPTLMRKVITAGLKNLHREF